MKIIRRIFGRPGKPSKHEQIMSKLSDLTATLTNVSATQTKALGEINSKLTTLLQRITDLEGQLGDVELSAEQQAALDAVLAGAKALDDVVPDAPPA